MSASIFSSSPISLVGVLLLLVIVLSVALIGIYLHFKRKLATEKENFYKQLQKAREASHKKELSSDNTKNEKHITPQESNSAEKEKTSNRRSRSKLPVCKEPIEESQNIDLDCFSYFKGMRLLVVEDNLINQKIIASVLKKSGMKIDIANNGQEALNLLFAERKMFDIVLMDISMPVMDGIIATRHIREREEYDEMPIVAFTAFAIGVEIEQMFDAGCNAYLTKPLNIQKLYHVFSMFLHPDHKEASFWKSIETGGLDVEIGIYNADESEALYRETLKEFMQVYRDMSQTIPKWIEEKNYERVKLACDEIDTILGAIGAYEMKALVNEMQKHFLYGNETFLDQYTKSYPEKWNALVDAIEYYLQS